MKHEHALRGITLQIKALRSNITPPAPLPYDDYAQEAEEAIRSLEDSSRLLQEDAGIIVGEEEGEENG